MVATKIPRALHLGHVHETIVACHTIALNTSLVLVGKTRLHNFLEAATFLVQLVDRLIFCHKCALQVLNHSLLDLLQVLDTLLIHLLLSLLAVSHLIVRTRDSLIVHVLVETSLVLRILALGVKMAGLVILHLLVHVRVLKLLGDPVLNLFLQAVPTHHIGSDHIVPMLVDPVPVRVPPIRVQIELCYASIFYVFLPKIFVQIVLLFPCTNLVREIRMLIGHPDLFLQSRLFVLQLPQAILEHLSLINDDCLAQMQRIPS